MIQALSESGWDRVIIETVGVGQGEFAVISVANRILLVDGPDRGDVLQAEKAGILEIADLIACNKSDLPGSLNACLLYTSPSPRDLSTSRMPSSA